MKAPHTPLVAKLPRKRRKLSGNVKKRQTKKTVDTNTVGLQKDGQWEVEEILDMDDILGKKQFLVKWRGWSHQYNSWEPLQNVYDCQFAIIDYFKKNRSEQMKAKLRGDFSEEALKMKRDEVVIISSEVLEEFMQEIRVDGKLQLKEPSKEEVDLKVKKLFYHFNDNDLRDARNAILAQKLCVLRKQQRLQLQDWENEMNTLAPHEAPISVENDFDLEVAPQQFTFISSYIPGPGVTLPEDPPIGCSCSSCGPKTLCCNAQNDAVFAYNRYGKLVVPQGTPVFECNKKCSCGDDCTNRVVQKGRQVHLAIFRTSNGCGWGVKAKQFIKKGTFLCQYVGEVISNEEAEVRGEKYDADGRTYLFDLDFNDVDNCYTVDAAMYGNVSHFINHSCDPNCGVFAVWINCLDPNIPCLGLFALSDIPAEEQITFSYTSQVTRTSRMSRSMRNDSLDLSSSSFEEDRPKTKCKCDAVNCRNYLF